MKKLYSILLCVVVALTSIATAQENAGVATNYAGYLNVNILDVETGELIWTGSGRIFSQSNFTTFKDFLEESGYFEMAQGHQGAFGCAIKDTNIQTFTDYANRELINFDFTHCDFLS